MPLISVARTIQAPPEVVFQAVTDIGNLPATNPEILRVEFLSEQRAGAGARFRETRLMGRKEMDTELEMTEFSPPISARMVSDQGGTVWDTTFVVQPSSSGAELQIHMDARAHRLLAKIMNPLLQGLYRKGLQKHLDAVAAYCEGAPLKAREKRD